MGLYFCPSCDVHLYQTDDIAYCYQQKTRSLAEKQNLVVQGKFGKIKHLKSTLKDLAPVLKKELRGVKRLPILLLNNPGLAKYEITLVECMHDIAHHNLSKCFNLPVSIRIKVQLSKPGEICHTSFDCSKVGLMKMPNFPNKWWRWWNSQI